MVACSERSLDDFVSPSEKVSTINKISYTYIALKTLKIMSAVSEMFSAASLFHIPCL